MDNVEFWEWVEMERERRRLSYSEIERIAEVGNATVSRPARNMSAPSVTVCLAISLAFGMDTEDVFRKAGLLPPLPEPVAEEREAIAILRELPAAVRRIVLTMLRALARPGASPPAPALELPDDIFVPELLEEFEQVPEEWRPEAISQVRWIRQLAERPRFQVIGEEAEEIEAERNAAPEG